MAASSKIAAVLITYPANNVKMNQQAHSGPGDNCKAIDLFRRVGIRGLYRGLGPNLLHVTPNVCLVFLCYELINKVLSSD